MPDVDQILLVVRLLALWIAVGSALVLTAFLAANLARPRLAFWPATGKWQKPTALWLFRVFCGALVGVAVADLILTAPGYWLRYAIGLVLMAVSYGVTLWAYRLLGAKNTYFGQDGLVTSGLYAYSRNPQYVFSVLAALGLGILSGSVWTLALTAALFVLYLLFALNEERWLKQNYGKEFAEYSRQAPRFVDERSLKRARADLSARFFQRS